MFEFVDMESIEAKCLQMCPPSECIKREKERLIHILETDLGTNPKQRKANRSKMIKSYNRSAAGQDLTKSELLRPPSILFKTIDYIFNNVIHDNRVSKIGLYNFIDDRLRSIKQDGIVQRLSPETWFQLLTPIVHFYVYSAYSFCEEPITNFDQKLNNDQIVDCLTRFIKLYEDHPYERHAVDYAEMEALYLVVNFDKIDIINRAVLLNLHDEIFQKTLKFVLKCFTNNYFAAFRQLQSLSVLPACLFVALHLNKMRKRALEIMSFAYSSKNVYYPVAKLKTDLLFNSRDEATNHCKFYSIDVTQDHNVQFIKKKFPLDEAYPKKLKFLDKTLTQIPLSELVLRSYL